MKYFHSIPDGMELFNTVPAGIEWAFNSCWNGVSIPFLQGWNAHSIPAGMKYFHSNPKVNTFNTFKKQNKPTRIYNNTYIFLYKIHNKCFFSAALLADTAAAKLWGCVAFFFFLFGIACDTMLSSSSLLLL